MFQILFESPSGEKFCKMCKTVPEKDRYIEKLNAKGVEYHLVGEVQPQLCGCIFKVGEKIYNYVRVEGDAEPGMLGTVDVQDTFGNSVEKTVAILKVEEATASKCREICNKLGRTKLARIKRVWNP